MMNDTCRIPWSCTADGRSRYCDIDSLSPGAFIDPGVIPNQVRLPKSVHDVVWLWMKSRLPDNGPPAEDPDQDLNRDVEWLVPIDDIATAAMTLDLLSPDDAVFERDVMPPANFDTFWSSNKPFGKFDGHGVGVTEISNMSHCATTLITTLSWRWTVPMDLDKEFTYQFRLRTNISETEYLSDVFRITNLSTVHYEHESEPNTFYLSSLLILLCVLVFLATYKAGIRVLKALYLWKADGNKHYNSLPGGDDNRKTIT